MGGSGSERRAHPREAVEIEARVSASGRTASAASVNLSEGGALLVGESLPPGDRLEVAFDFGDLGWHALAADVVRREPGPDGGERLAARFASAATEGGREAIRAFFAARLGA